MKCHFCPTMVEKRDAFCFGCMHAVCDGCDKNHDLMGRHNVDEHLEGKDEW